MALAGCPGDDSSGEDDGGNDSGSTTATSTPATTTQTSGPEDSSGTTAADSGSATETGTPATDSGATDSGGSSSGGSDSGGQTLCGDALPIVGLVGSVSFEDVNNFPEPPPVGGGGSASTTTGGPPPPPSDEWRLIIGNYDLTCENPYGSYECKAFDKWRLWIDIPLANQVVGVHDLADMDIFFSEIGAGVPPDCGGGAGTTGASDGGGGGGWDGQLIIESIGPNGITGCIDGAQFSFDANGTFDTTACIAM